MAKLKQNAIRVYGRRILTQIRTKRTAWEAVCEILWEGLGNKKRAAEAILRLVQHHILPIQLSGSDMITKSMNIQGLHVISLALTPIERWEAARRHFKTAYTSEAWLTLFAVVALITSVMLLFWLIARRRHSEHRLKKKISADLKRELWK